MPTMDSATWCPTPAATSAASRLRPEIWKNSSTALSSNDGELVRSITTCAPASVSFNPAPVMVLTPVLDEAATTSWSRPRKTGTVFEPIRPLPPITTIFMAAPPHPAGGQAQRNPPIPMQQGGGLRLRLIRPTCYISDFGND